MIGFMTLGVAAALNRRPLLGIALCAIAATIKAPAAISAVVILLCWLRADGTRLDRSKHAVGATVVASAALVAASLVTGLGFEWLSPSVLATPGRVHLATTPVSELAWVFHALDANMSVQHAQSIVGKVLLGVAALLVIWLLVRARQENLVRTAGIVLLAVAALGPAAWPWYFTWGIALIACDPKFQRSRALLVGIVIGCVVIKPDGILALPYSASAFVMVAYLATGAAAILASRRRIHNPAAVPDVPHPTSTARS